MSGLFEKTIESIHSFLTASHVSLSPKYMYEKCFGARTKREEENIFRECLKTTQEFLSDPGVRSSTVKKCLAFVAFAEMMGYKAEFAYIHAVKLAQQGSISEKKLGYMVCIQLLRDSHDLSPLLVNTVLRDMASRNVITIAMALAASCYLIPPDQAGSLLSMVVDKLNNSNEYIRGKAVIVMHHFLKTSPEQAMPYIHSVRTLLGDRDPGVVSHVLSYLLHVAQEYPEYAPDLASSVVSVQQQIITGKLPKDYLHHGMSAPWAQVTIMRLLRKLRPDFADVQTLLDNTLRILGDLSTPMAAAIAVECLITMLELSGTANELVAPTMSIVAQLLANKNSNLRYEGLTLMMALSSHHKLKLGAKEESLMESFRTHPDQSLRLQTLYLMCSVADKTTAEGICNQILDFIKLEHPAPPLQFRLVAQAASLAERFPGSNYWHLALFLRLLPLAQPSEVLNLQAKIMMALRDDRDRSVTTARKKVLGYLRKHSESKTAPTNVLELYVWGVSHFHSVAEMPTSESQSNVASMRAIASLGQKIIQNATRSGSTPCTTVPSPIRKLMVEIIRAESRLIKSSSSVDVAENVPQLLLDLIAASKSHICGDVVLRCACEEMQTFLQGHPGRVLENPVSPDWTLSFLDETICAHLEGDGKPLRPLRVGLTPYAALHEMLQAGLSASAPHQHNLSLGSSEVSLAGTETEEAEAEGAWPHGSSSTSSPHSGCWLYSGPQVETSVPVWTKDGRVKMETPNTANANSIPKSENQSCEVPAADPLDELENTFSETVS